MHKSFNVLLLLLLAFVQCILHVSHGIEFDGYFRCFGVKRTSQLSNEFISEVRDDILNKSNHYRELHKLQKFTIDKTIQNYAQKMATQIVKTRHIKYNEKLKYKENVYNCAPYKHMGEILVDFWYMELCHFGKNDSDENKARNLLALNLTQLLWRDSKKIGIGVAKGNDEIMYTIVVNFKPRGNVVGEYETNQPKFDVDQMLAECTKETQIRNAQKVDRFNLVERPYYGDEEFPDLPGWSTVLHKVPNVIP